MHNQFFPGNVIRNKPIKGKFEVFIVEGHVLDMLEVRKRADDGSIYETEFWKPDDVELYEFSCSVGTYKIGDMVRLLGLDGKYEVLGFKAGEHDETRVKIVDAGGPSSWPAHYAKVAS